MMKKQFDEIVDQAIQLELNVAELYNLFCREFEQDFDFWWALVEEEHNHAALLRSLKQIGPVLGGIPHEFFPEKLEDIKTANQRVHAVIADFKKHPSRSKAFRVAYEIENSAGEVHYQKFMEQAHVPQDFEVFQKLNNSDKDHAERIMKYMTEHHIV